MPEQAGQSKPRSRSSFMLIPWCGAAEDTWIHYLTPTRQRSLPRPSSRPPFVCTNAKWGSYRSYSLNTLKLISEEELKAPKAAFPKPEISQIIRRVSSCSHTHTWTKRWLWLRPDNRAGISTPSEPSLGPGSDSPDWEKSQRASKAYWQTSVSSVRRAGESS